MKKQVFKGSATAIVTPMDQQGAIDYPALERLLDFQLSNGTDAIVVNGTTGESATLKEPEIIALTGFTIRFVNHRIPVIAGTGSNCTEQAVALSRKAEILGADALLQVTPYYNKTSQEGLAAHFLAVAEQVSIPVILYNIPGRTGVSISPETCLALSAHKNIAGLKDAGGNLSLTARTAALCKDELPIYSGNDDQILPILSLGGEGAISVASNLIPAEIHRICQAYREGDTEQSRSLQLGLLDLINALFLDVNPIPVKAALAAMGLCGENYRLPLTKMKAEDKIILFKAMKKHHLIA